MSMSSRGWLLVSAPLLAATLWAGTASADAAGNKVLADMDAAVNRAKTQKFEYEAINQEPGKAEKRLSLAVYMKGEKRLTEFQAPADMKGTKVLILSSTQMYVYLPAFKKVRRIASHVTDQGFMGLAFSQDDFATQNYAPLYEAKLVSETGTESKLELTSKPGQETAYAKIEVTVAKDMKVPTELKYYNAEGKNVKTETRTGYTCESNVCTPGELKMVDHTKGGLWTKMVRKSWKVNTDLSDDLFSKRNLEK
jgi:outer membrane lipoprotein-sorting protein